MPYNYITMRYPSERFLLMTVLIENNEMKSANETGIEKDQNRFDGLQCALTIFN